MKEFQDSDKLSNAKPPQTAVQGRNLSRTLLTEALADLAPQGRITHRTGTHLNQYHGVAISPDGSKMLTANRDRTARLWDIATGQCLMVFEGHTGELRRAAFLRDGTRAVTTADDGTLRVWDLATGACSLVLAGHTGIVTALAVSPGDRYVLSGGEDKTVRIWSLAAGSQEHIIEEAGGRVKKILVTPDGASIVVLSSDDTIRCWSLPDLRGPFPVARGNFPNSFKDIALAGDGKVVAATGGDGLHWFDMLTGARERLLSFKALWPYKVAVTPDGARLAACCTYGTILVVNHETGIVEKELTGHQNDVTGMEIAPDGKTLCTVSLDWTCRTWNMDTGLCTRILRVARNLHGLSLSGAGDALAARDESSAVKVWNLTDGSNRFVTREATSAAFLPAAGLLATGHRDGTIHLWESRRDKTEPAAVLTGHRQAVIHLVPLRSGALVASCTVVEAGLWNIEKGECLGIVSVSGRAAVLAMDDDGGRFAVSRLFEEEILIMDFRSGLRLGLLTGHRQPGLDGVYAPVPVLSFVSHGSKIISCGRDGRVILWDLATFSILESIHEPCSDIISLAVEDDEHHVLVGTYRGSLERWDLASGRREVLWPGEGQPLLSIVLSPDGRRIFASLADGTVRIIDRQSGILLCSLRNVDDGFFWFTPPDEHAPDGWIWTDRDDLLHVIEKSGEGNILGAVPFADERRRTYVGTRNNAAMVRARLQGLEEYGRVASHYARSLEAKQRETPALSLTMLPKGEENA